VRARCGALSAGADPGLRRLPCTRRPQPHANGKHPNITAKYESVNVPGLFFAGSLMHSHGEPRDAATHTTRRLGWEPRRKCPPPLPDCAADFKKSSGGFIHGEWRGVQRSPVTLAHSAHRPP